VCALTTQREKRWIGHILAVQDSVLDWFWRIVLKARFERKKQNITA